MADTRDLIIIGSGPGGYVAAIRAAQLGLSVTVVEKDPFLGGACLHRGCIPTKALLHTASLLDQARKAGSFGVRVEGVDLDMEGAHSHKKKVVRKNAKGIEYLFKKNRVETVRGRGQLAGPNRVEVEHEGESTTLEASNILVATGSVPRELPFAHSDGERILNSDHLLELDRVPESLTVLGAGAVGLEFASIFASFGSRVTVVEMLPRILPMEDEEISFELAKALHKRGIEIHTNTRLQEAQRTENGLRLEVEESGASGQIDSEMLLVAVGRAPVTEGLGLEEAGITVVNGYIQVDEYMRTSMAQVRAIGDVTQTSPWLAHVASAEGVLAAEHIAGQSVQPLDYDNVPSVTFCDPEVGSVGLTEAEARDRGYDVAVGRFPFAALGKAAIEGKTTGFVKLVRETRYDEVLGVHILGAHATDLVAEAGVARRLESTTEELARTIHAHPTLAEGVAEAAHAALGHAIHI